MKKITVLIILISLTKMNAQETEVKTGLIIENFGKVYQIDNPDLLLKKDTEYKVIFNIYTDNSKDNNLNPLLNTVARYLNVHAQQGILLENMKVVVVLHGAATKSALSDTAYQKLFKTDNPNTELIQDLKNANVELYVCGQSYLANGFKLNEKSPDVKLALSALTALVEYQNNGYLIINFN
ncbi:MAG: DsrE family protein [Flavobacteriaceae bacterium]|nr:DsrE family protein [Flavobacteriaceae bacterium]